MSSAPQTNDTPNWSSIRVSLTRFWEGAPIGQVGTFKGTVLTVWLMLAGEVTLNKAGCQVSAKRGQWIVCHPGARHQQFTDSARILSLHLRVESPANAARWTGSPIVAFKDNVELARCLSRLRGTVALRQLSAEGRLNPEGAPASLDEMLELKEQVTAFFRRLMVILRARDMSYEASPIRDPRVRGSRQRLVTTDFRQGFSRAELAANSGVSASQLDRLWMLELGETPKHFWNWRRLETACALLLEERTGKEVAFETGFAHLSQFSLWFRANMGESPREFQARHGR